MVDLTWIVPADADSDEPSAHVAHVGAFKLWAWRDGYWAIAFAEDSEILTECPDRAESLDEAKRLVFMRLRGLVLATAEAVGILRFEVARG